MLLDDTEMRTGLLQRFVGMFQHSHLHKETLNIKTTSPAYIPVSEVMHSLTSEGRKP